MGIFDYDENTPGFQTPRDSISFDSLLGLKGPNISLDDDEGVVDLTTDSLENINVGGGSSPGQSGRFGDEGSTFGSQISLGDLGRAIDIESVQDLHDVMGAQSREEAKSIHAGMINADLGKLGKAILGGLPGMVSLGLDILSDGKIKAPTISLGTIVGTNPRRLG
jgi:hypothetical protein